MPLTPLEVTWDNDGVRSTYEAPGVATNKELAEGDKASQSLMEPFQMSDPIRESEEAAADKTSSTADKIDGYMHTGIGQPR